MERKIGHSTKDQPEFYCNPESVGRLLEDKDALHELVEYRALKDKTELAISTNLREHFTEIYQAFEPLAIRLVDKTIGKFARINQETRDDIQAEQRLRLWSAITERFNWGNYPNADFATGALMNYLNKSTGSFFAQEVIEGQRLRFIDRPRRTRNLPFERRIEDELIAKELPDAVNKAWNKWKESAPDVYVEAVEGRYIGGKSISELAKEKGVKEGTMKVRLIRGKKRLFNCLVEEEVLTSEDVMSGELILGKESRRDLLDERRENILRVFSLWEELLTTKPKLRRALIAFYGLGDDRSAMYNYELTAKQTGISPVSARVHVSGGTRLLFNQLGPSEKSQTVKKESQKFVYWQKHKEDLQFTPEVEQIFELYFSQGRTLSKISEIIGASKETVRRRKKYALNLIETVMHSNV